MEYREHLRSIVRAMVARAADGQPGDERLDTSAQERLGAKLFAALANPHIAARDRAKVQRNAANETYFRGRDLEYILRDPYPVQYEPLLHRTVVPVVPLPPGASRYTYRMSNSTSEAELSSSLAGAVPDADISTTETPTPRYFVKEKYHYTIEDLRAAAFSGMPLPTDRRRACMTAVERKLNKVAWQGDAATGITGFVDIRASALETAGDYNGTWSAADFGEILSDILQLANAISVNTLENWGPGVRTNDLVLVVSHKHGARMRTVTSSGAGSMDETVWAAVERLFPGIRIISTVQFHDGAANGTDERVAMYHFNQDVVRQAIAEYQESEPQYTAYQWDIYGLAATTGPISIYQGAIAAVDLVE